MTCYELDVTDWKPALAVVAAHGMTDLHNLEWVPQYAMWMLMPMPSVAVTTTFCAASVVHFSDDSGPWPAALVHGAAALIGARVVIRGVQSPEQPRHQRPVLHLDALTLLAPLRQVEAAGLDGGAEGRGVGGDVPLVRQAVDCGDCAEADQEDGARNERGHRDRASQWYTCRGQ